MPSFRRSASRAPRSPLASAVSAAFKIRSFSAAENRRRDFGATVSTAAPFTPRARCAASATASSARPGIGFGLGTFAVPVSALRYRKIQRKLSHATLARRVSPPRPDGRIKPSRSCARPERHFIDSFTTIRLAIARVLARWLPRCPACHRFRDPDAPSAIRVATEPSRHVLNIEQ